MKDVYLGFISVSAFLVLVCLKIIINLLEQLIEISGL